MNRSLRLGLWLTGLALCQSALATSFLPDFSKSHLLADSIPPVITCPASDTVQLGPGQCGQVVQYGAVTATDNLPIFTIQQTTGLPSGAIFSIGSTVNTFVARDAANNTASCSFTIVVRNFYSLLVCKELSIIKLNGNCSHSVLPTDILMPGANGCSANFIVEVDKTFPFGNGPWLPANLGMSDQNKSYQFRVTAPSTGNRCFGLGEIKDTVPPTITCQDVTVPCVVLNLAPDYLNDSLSISASQPSYTDNCGTDLALSYTDVIANLPCDTVSAVTSTITRIWTARDASNNQRTCVQKINRTRSLGDVHFPASATLGCMAPNLAPLQNGVPYIAVAGVRFPLFPNAACGNEVLYFDTLVPQCGGTRLMKRTWKVRDICRPLSATNPLRGVQNLQIRDIGAPTIACPPTTKLRVSQLGCQGQVKLPNAVITDGCSSIATFTAEWPATEGGQVIGKLSNWPGNDPTLRDTLGGLDSLDFPTGTTVIQYAATDLCGNSTTCSFTVIVADTIPPTAFCRPLVTVQLSTAGHFELAADSLDDGSNDECNPVYFKVRRQLPNVCQPNNKFYDAASLCCADLGDTVTLRLRVYDVPPPAGVVSLGFDSAYVGECVVRVRVTDPHPPLCTAPPDVVVQCDTFDATLNSYGQLLTRSCAADSLHVLVNYAQFDTSCRRGQIVRTFRVTSVDGNTSECTQRITVNTRQHYFVRFPNDTLVTACTIASSFGKPQLFGLACERMQMTFTDQVINSIPGACFKIERTWTIVNRCQYDSLQPLTVVPNPEPTTSADSSANLRGPTVSANGTTGAWAPTLTKISPTSTTATNFRSFWSANSNGYLYKQIIRFVDYQDPVFSHCPATALTFSDSTINSNELWNEDEWLDPTTARHDLSDIPVQLTTTAFDACRGENISLNYLLFLDLDGNGEQETVIKSTQPPAFGKVNYGNAFNTNYVGGVPLPFDERTVPNNQKYGFALETTITNHQKTAWVRWNTSQTPTQYSNAQLPRGHHKIIWTAEDGCGNTATCQYDFTIRDGLPPALACIGAPLLRKIGSDHTRQVELLEISHEATDNYSPSNRLEYSLRRSGTGTGFPVDSSGQPNRSITFDCDDLGLQGLQLWVRDQDKNASSCQVIVTLQDPDGICTEALPTVGGTITTALTAGVADVQVGISATHAGMPPYSAIVHSDSMGHYAFANGFPAGTAYTLTPTKDGNALNGVTTYDLVLISRHVLGVEPIASPYKLIAADANKSNSITALDVLELRKLILGIYETGLPNVKSWRFVSKSFVFPTPTNPFQTVFPETRSVASLASNQLPNDFMAIKVGDVDCSAMPRFSGLAEDRAADTLWFEVAERTVQSGETVEVVFRAMEAVEGYQFTLDYPGLEVLGIQPGAAMQADNFAIFASRNALTTSFDAPKTATPAEFTVRFRVRQTGSLSQMLHLSSRITPAEAYTTETGVWSSGVGLYFAPITDSVHAFGSLTCTPNPFLDQTTIKFRLPAATMATLRVFDAAGRAVYNRTADYATGFHTLVIHQSDLGGSGVFFCQLQTSGGSLVRKMVVLR